MRPEDKYIRAAAVLFVCAAVLLILMACVDMTGPCTASTAVEGSHQTSSVICREGGKARLVAPGRTIEALPEGRAPPVLPTPPASSSP